MSQDQNNLENADLMEEDIDQDELLLQSFLDDELSPIEVQHVQLRLSTEPGLLDQLNELRQLRSMSASFYLALESPPSQATVSANHCVAAIRAAAFRQRLFHYTRSTGVVAACVLIGMFIHRQLNQPVVQPAPLALKPGESAHIQTATVWKVTLLDSAGKTLAVQQFDSEPKAREFAADLNQIQNTQHNLAASQFVIQSDRF